MVFVPFLIWMDMVFIGIIILMMQISSTWRNFHLWSILIVRIFWVPYGHCQSGCGWVHHTFWWRFQCFCPQGYIFSWHKHSKRSIFCHRSLGNTNYHPITLVEEKKASMDHCKVSRVQFVWVKQYLKWIHSGRQIKLYVRWVVALNVDLKNLCEWIQVVPCTYHRGAAPMWY